jgi:hypothetical protein
MNARPCLAHAGQLPAPATGDDSLHAFNDANDAPARLRTPCWPGDSTARLHALASLITQAQQLLPRPSTTPVTRHSPAFRSASCSTSPPPPRHADTGASHE